MSTAFAFEKKDTEFCIMIYVILCYVFATVQQKCISFVFLASATRYTVQYSMCRVGCVCKSHVTRKCCKSLNPYEKV